MKKVELNLKQIASDFENGLTRPELAEKYGLTVGAITKALKEKGLGGARAKQKSWVWVDDEEVVETTPVVVEDIVVDTPIMDTVAVVDEVTAPDDVTIDFRGFEMNRRLV